MLNALWLGFTLLGGVVLGIGPATVAACTLSRRRLRGEVVRAADFARLWRAELLAGSAAMLPALAVAGTLCVNYLLLSGLGPRAVLPRLLTLAALVVVIGVVAYLGPMYAYYDLPLSAYLPRAARFALARPAGTVLLLLVFATISFATVTVPVLLVTVSFGTWLHVSTWLCMRFFESNDARLAAESGVPEPSGALQRIPGVAAEKAVRRGAAGPFTSVDRARSGPLQSVPYPLGPAPERPMDTPFNPFILEEMFPDGPGVARLPRRLADSSPEGLAVTLIADYTWRTQAWLPSPMIAALLGELGVSSDVTRTTISGLVRRGVLEGSRQGRYSYYRLTREAIADLCGGAASIASFTTHPDYSWDGSWTLISFSVPEEGGTTGRALRSLLRWRGYAPSYDNVWLSPHPLTASGRSDLAVVAPGAMTAFRAREVALYGEANRNPVEAWDLPAIRRQYEAFTRRWRPLLPRIAAGAVRGVEAVQVRTKVMDSYRRFPVIDPLLPLELLPPGWPRTQAREVFVAVYDGLAEPAQEHVRAVAAEFGDGSHGGIRAHTLGAMGAGVSRRPD